MRLLKLNRPDNSIETKNFVNDDDIPPYAILSHTWGLDTDEVTLADLKNDTGKQKVGFEKILFCGEQARQDDLEYFWVDSCCIDKSDSVELQEAINSMFRWYQRAKKCYVYLSDVSQPTVNIGDDMNNLPCEQAFRKSRWFTRGWTLQELLAPEIVEFFSKERVRIGNKKSLERYIAEVTGIPIKVLRGDLFTFSISERLSWQENRNATRKEDKAYSLLGICGVHISLIYGEGEKNAYRRLQAEIDSVTKGESNSHYLLLSKCIKSGSC